MYRGGSRLVGRGRSQSVVVKCRSTYKPAEGAGTTTHMSFYLGTGVRHTLPLPLPPPLSPPLYFPPPPLSLSLFLSFLRALSLPLSPYISIYLLFSLSPPLSLSLSLSLSTTYGNRRRCLVNSASRDISGL